jgi:CRISPR/Cas system-associated protein Cas7 (RAMP superfamily)
MTTTTEADARALKNELRTKAKQLRKEGREARAKDLISALIRIAGAAKQNRQAPDRVSSSVRTVSEKTKKEMQHAKNLLEEIDID